MPSNEDKRIRILLVDDHPLLRQGVRQIIEDEPDLVVCGEAEDAEGALRLAVQRSPDLAIVDLSLNGRSGLDLIRDLAARFPRLPSLVLSMYDESLYAERALHAGARGYIMKREASQKVLAAIRHVLAGGVFVSAPVCAGILNKVTGQPETSTRPALDVLSNREMEVLRLIGQGYGARQISRQLHVSPKTVEAHRANMKLKLKLDSGNELLQYAIRCARQQGDI